MVALSDNTIEILALTTIILGLGALFFFVLDYSPSDAFLGENNDNSFMKGILLSKKELESGYSLLNVYSCKEITALYNGNVSKEINDDVYIEGEFNEGTFYAKFIR